MAYAYVRMTDKFMSGWGMARGMRNVMIVECDDWNQAEAVKQAALKRSEMRNVAICIRKPRARSGILFTVKKFADLGGPWLEFYRKAA